MPGALLQPAALLNIRQFLLSARLLRPAAVLARPVSKRVTRRPAIAVSLVLSGGMAIKPDFRAVVAQYALQPDGFVGRRQRVDGLARVELASAFAADHEVAILLLCELCDVAAVAILASMMTSAPFGAVRPFEHVRKGCAFGDIAGEHPRAAHEPAAIEHESESDERAIGALLLERPWAALGLPAAPFKIRVGQIAESDVTGRPNRSWRGRTGLPRFCRDGAREGRRSGSCISGMESKFTPRSSPRALRSSSHRQSRDRCPARPYARSGCRDGGALNAIEAEVREDRIDAQPVHGEDRGFPHAGGPGSDELQRGDIDLGEE